MKTAIIFPGQGSQYVGMGYDFYKKYEASKDIFDRLDTSLQRNLSNLIFKGEISELSKTQNSQPAIMAVSIAILAALKSEKLIQNNSYQAVAGHSLGEYSALVANGSITFEDSAKLLKIRSKAMQESMPIGTGGMVAIIGTNIDSIENILLSASSYGKIFVANDNADGQVVLSGEIEAINFIVNNKRELNIKRAIKLPVTAPFHCELMKNASNVLSSEIKKINFDKFNVPLYSNVTASICSELEIGNLLVQQVVSKVRWRETIQNMIKDGYMRYIEVGPGTVLSNIIKRAAKDSNVFSIEKLEDFEKLESILK